jgi:hypothetical protein
VQNWRILCVEPLGLVSVRDGRASSSIGLTRLIYAPYQPVALRIVACATALSHVGEFAGSGCGLAEQPAVLPGLEELFGLLLNLPDSFPGYS